MKIEYLRILIILLQSLADRIVFSCDWTNSTYFGYDNETVSGPIVRCIEENSLKTCYCDSDLCNSLGFKLESNFLISLFVTLTMAYAYQLSLNHNMIFYDAKTL